MIIVLLSLIINCNDNMGFTSINKENRKFKMINFFRKNTDLQKHFLANFLKKKINQQGI